MGNFLDVGDKEKRCILGTVGNHRLIVAKDATVGFAIGLSDIHRFDGIIELLIFL